jgi:hypothetical protein
MHRHTRSSRFIELPITMHDDIETQDLLDRLGTVGYKVYRKICPLLLTDAYHKRNRNFTTVWGQDDGGNDRKRQVCDIDHAQKPQGLKNLTTWLRTLLPTCTSIKWGVLVSSPGCKAQGAHADYHPQQLASIPVAYRPLLCLAATMDNTKLLIWPGMFIDNIVDKARPCEKEMIHLDAGDVLIFRGDLIHAGAAYNILNVRYHGLIEMCVVDSKPWKIFKQSSAVRSMILY